MGIQIEQTQYVLLPVGEYPAEISEIVEDEGMFGKQLKFTFDIEDGEHAGQSLLGWTSAKFSPKSKLYGWSKAAFNAQIPKDYNFNRDDLINRKVNLTVVVKEGDDGAEFNRIEAVRPYSPKTKSDNGSDPSSLFPSPPN